MTGYRKVRERSEEGQRKVRRRGLKLVGKNPGKQDSIAIFLLRLKPALGKEYGKRKGKYNKKNN
jgi:hypothetical protein